MAENGERKPQGNAVKSCGATSLADLGIPKDRASRAMQAAIQMHLKRAQHVQ
jgi:hypothetical protein